MTKEKETKTCQNCRNSFVIDAEDFNFYEKIKVPPPTWCPECRFLRKLTFRNERILYKSKCKLCGNYVISMYSENADAIPYCQKCWWSDDWDPFSFSQEYNFSKNFFSQFKSLFQKVPIPTLNNINSVNSEYCNHTYNSKNCYLNFASDINEDSAYLYHTIETKNSYDLFGCKNQNICYQGLYSHNCYRCFFTYFSDNCLDSAFLFNCNNCQNCLGCVNLRNAKFCIFNERYSKEDYYKELAKYDIGSHKNLEEFNELFKTFQVKFPRRFAQLIKVSNATGEYLFNAKNCRDCFDVEGPIENSKNIIYGIPNIKDSYDIFGTGAGVELCYEIIGCGLNIQNIAFSIMYESYSSRYSLYCRGSNNLFGCVGLRNKQYCILNKQYSKEEYENLVPRIIEHMNKMPNIDQKGRIYKYGEFFPPELSPFVYNETIAQEYFPLTKEQAIEQGYKWKNPEPRNYQITISPDQLPDHIKDVPNSITQEIIGCSHAKLPTSQVDNLDRLESVCNEQCTTAFKIIPDELQFYRKMNLPLPRLCPNCRHYQRLNQRNPLKLWHRSCQCAGKTNSQPPAVNNQQPATGYQYQNTIAHFHGDQPCPNEFETSYAPERPEIVYCEACYNAEVV